MRILLFSGKGGLFSCAHFAIAFCLSARLAYSQAPITDLLKMSDVVLIGTPASFEDQAGATVIKITVAQWLSSAPTGAPSLLSVLGPPRPASSPTPSTPSNPTPGIWFLSNKGGTYTVIPVRHGKAPLNAFIAAPRGTCPVALMYAPDMVLTDKIALELACAASQDSSASSAVANNVLSGTYGLATSQVVHDAFLYLTQQTGSRQKAIGIAFLTSASDTMGLLLLEQHLQDLTEYDLQVNVAPYLLNWRKSDTASVKSLGRIATSPRATGGLLKYACTALVSIHSADTLPYLRLLLDNPDRNIRMDAIGGFVAFIMGYPVHTAANSLTMEFMQPLPSPYAADATWQQFALSNPTDAQLQTAVAFWKQWLSSHPELPQQ